MAKRHGVSKLQILNCRWQIELLGRRVTVRSIAFSAMTERHEGVVSSPKLLVSPLWGAKRAKAISNNFPLGKGYSEVFVAKAKKTERQRGKPWFSLGEPSTAKPRAGD